MMVIKQLHAVLLVMILLTGCARTEILPPADLNILVPKGMEEKALRAAVAAFRESSELRVRVEALGDEFYIDHVAALLLAGSSDYDLVLLPGDSLAYWAGYHALRPFTPFDDPDQQPWLAALQVEGEQIGLPTQPDVEVLWYRADLFAAAGLDAPRAWEDFRAAALALNAPPQVYGAAVAGSGLDAGSELGAVLAGFGARAVSADYQVEIDSSAAREALEFYASLSDPVTLPGREEATRAAVQDSLARGKAALGIAPLSSGERLRSCRASPKACAGERPLLAWDWLPGMAEAEGYGSLSAWAVPLRAAHPQAAEDFVRWLCAEEGAAAWASGGGTPANRPVLSTLGSGGQALARVETWLYVFPPLVNSDKQWKVIHTAAHSAAAGLADPDQLAEEAAAALEQLLCEEGYSH